jgi:hypothetical protein
MPLKAPTQPKAKPTLSPKPKIAKENATKKTRPSKTTLTVKYDCGYNNFIAIRGCGSNLSWDKGTPLKNVKNNEWVFEFDAPFKKIEYKVLINDTIYESGANKTLHEGKNHEHTPHF